MDQDGRLQVACLHGCVCALRVYGGTNFQWKSICARLLHTRHNTLCCYSGWMHAFLLWNFVISSTLLLQKLIIALGLCGLLPGQCCHALLVRCRHCAGAATPCCFPPSCSASRRLHTCLPAFTRQYAVPAGAIAAAAAAGEEVVTRESFVSIGWRLVPYWLNQWEQQWGAECSSMLFELPHFALELLVVLPCVQVSVIACSLSTLLFAPAICLCPGVGWTASTAPTVASPSALPVVSYSTLQILCGRLRVLAQPHVIHLPELQPPQPLAGAAGGVQGDVGPAAPMAAADPVAAAAADVAAAAAAVEQRQEGGAGGGGWVPDIMRRCWHRSPEQRCLLPRLRANLRGMLMIALVLAGGWSCRRDGWGGRLGGCWG